MKKYYFILYECTTTTFSNIETSTENTSVSVIKERDLIDIHPLKWEMECNSTFGSVKDGFWTREHAFCVQSWQEITEEEYLTFKDNF